MKVRTGFVSNSSSSSFCIYGCTFCHSDYPELCDYLCENKVVNFYYDHETNDYYFGKSLISFFDDENNSGKTIEECKKEVTEKITNAIKKFNKISENKFPFDRLFMEAYAATINN